MRLKEESVAKEGNTGSGERDLILKCVSIDELRNLLRVYQRGLGKPILIGVRDLNRLIVAALPSATDAESYVNRLGCDGWVVLSPVCASQSIPSRINLEGKILKRPIHARFDGNRLLPGDVGRPSKRRR
jgi:hypothetical protein